MYEQKDFGSARELISYLVYDDGARAGSKFVGEEVRYFYRGQGCASWQLTPAAHRKLDANETPQQRVAREIKAMRAFLNFGALQGSPQVFPDWGIALSRLMKGPEVTAWPPREWLSTLAVMQHCGVPTRLLDWSLSPLVAAMFAVWQFAKDAERLVEGVKDEKDRRLSVWLYVAPFKDNLWVLRDDAWPLYGYVAVPAAATPHLWRQRGLFTLVPEIDGAPKPCMTLDEIEKLTTSLVSPELTHCTLPWEQAKELSELLKRHGTFLFDFFEGNQGVVEYLQHEERLEKAHTLLSKDRATGELGA